MSKLSQKYGVTYQNLGEKGTKPIEEKLSQSGLQVLKKSKKMQKFLENLLLPFWRNWQLFGFFFQNW